MRKVLGGLGVAALLLVVALVVVWPSYRRMASVDRTVDASRMQIAPVTVGDLVRDAAADGRIVSANAPTLFAATAGIVALKVKAGDPVTRGQVLATIDSPELRSRFTQEQASLQSLEVALGRARSEGSPAGAGAFGCSESRSSATICSAWSTSRAAMPAFTRSRAYAGSASTGRSVWRSTWDSSSGPSRWETPLNTAIRPSLAPT